MVELSVRDHLSDAGVKKWVTELGVVDAPMPRRGIQAALRFFSTYMPRLPASMAINFLRATDLSKRVQAVLLGPTDVLVAYRTSSESQFKLFFTRAGQSVMSSGLNPADRRFVRFAVRAPVWALESYAGPAIDSWTRREVGQPVSVDPRNNTVGYLARGGALQLIVPESYRTLLVER